MKNILFDLDGTLTDSGEGIFHCAEITLAHFCLPVPDRSQLRFMVGPPLRESFPQLGIAPQDVEEAITVFRAHYNQVGIYENFPYPGIRELLEKLRAQGHVLCVATSKVETMAHVVLDHFDLTPCFDIICGSCAAEGRVTKGEVISHLLTKLDRNLETVMVGDTIYDVEGAAEFGIPTVGVAWGYGVTEDMRKAGAKAIAQDMDALYQYLQA